MTIRALLNDRFRAAMNAAGIPADCSPNIALNTREGLGDYQANGAMAAAKAMKMPPRELAERIVANLAIDDLADKVARCVAHLRSVGVPGR